LIRLLNDEVQVDINYNQIDMTLTRLGLVKKNDPIMICPKALTRLTKCGYWHYQID